MIDTYRASRLINKCRPIAKGGFNEKNCGDILRVLLADKAVLRAEFLPAGECVPANESEFYVPVLTGNAVAAVFHIVFDGIKPVDVKFIHHFCECMCADFNPKPVDKIVRNDTRWGIVEIHYAGSGHVHYYRPGKSTLFTDRVLQYIKPEEADAFIEDHFAALKRSLLKNGVQWIDETFALDYPLFKMKVRQVESDKLAHLVDADGVWWVEVPSAWDFSRENTQAYLREYFHQVVVSAAQPYFEERVAYLESRMHTGKKMSVKAIEIKRRNAVGLNHLNAVEPGSTMDDGSRAITIEAMLLLYPKKYSDIVLIHELCHNWSFDHSKRFRELETTWCLSIAGIGPDYFEDFFRTHRFVPFAPNPWVEK